MTTEQKEEFIAQYRTYFSSIYRYVALRVFDRSDTEDIVSDVFLKAFEHYFSYQKRRKVPFSSWLFRIAHNTIIDYIRTRKRVTITLEDAEGAASATPALGAIVDRKQLLLQVYAYVEQLPERQKQIVSLRLFGGRTIQEISEILSIKEKSVSSAYSRAIQKISHTLSYLL